MSDPKQFKLKVRSLNFPVVLQIDGCAVDATVKRFTVDELAVFQRGFQHTQDPHSTRMVSMRFPGEEQEKNPIVDPSDRSAFVISDEEIRRRRLVEMTTEQRAAYDAQLDADEAETYAFIVQALTDYLQIDPGQIAAEDPVAGTEQEITKGADFVRLFGNRRDILLDAVRAIYEENVLSGPLKNALRSLRASRPSSAGSSEPTPATTVAETAGASPVVPAESVDAAPCVTSATATASSEATSSGPTELAEA